MAKKTPLEQMARLLELDGLRKRIISEMSLIYRDLGIKPPAGFEVVQAAQPAQATIGQWSTVATGVAAGGAFTPQQREAPPLPYPKSNRERMLEVLSDGRPRSSAEIHNEMGQSTLNTVQTEISLLIKSGILVRQGFNIRLAKTDDARAGGGG